MSRPPPAEEVVVNLAPLASTKLKYPYLVTAAEGDLMSMDQAADFLASKIIDATRMLPPRFRNYRLRHIAMLIGKLIREGELVECIPPK